MFSWATAKELNGWLYSLKMSKRAPKASKVSLLIYFLTLILFVIAQVIYSSNFYMFSKEKKAVDAVAAHLTDLNDFTLTEKRHNFKGSGRIIVELDIFKHSQNAEYTLHLQIDKEQKEIIIWIDKPVDKEFDKQLLKIQNTVSAILQFYSCGIAVDSFYQAPLLPAK